MARSIQCHTSSNRFSSTSKYLTEYAESKSTDIFSRINKYDILHYTTNKWFVSHKSNREPKPIHENDGPFEVERYNNTHQVILCLSTGIMKCSCAGVVRIGMPCPHIAAIVKEKNPSMFHCRWFKLYSSLSYSKDNATYQAFERLREVQEKQPGGIDVKDFLQQMKPFSNVVLPHAPNSIEVARRMLLAFTMHVKKCSVKKTQPLHWLSSNNIKDPQYKNLIAFLDKGNHLSRTEDCDAVEDLLSSDSEDNLIEQSTNREVVTVTEDMSRYNVLTERVKRIHKLCEGRTDVYEQMLEMMNDMEVKALEIIAQTDVHVQNELEKNSKAGMVSSNAPIEKNPNRGRYKAAYERR